MAGSIAVMAVLRQATPVTAASGRSRTDVQGVVLDLIARNLPSRKPQLWRNLPRGLWRRLELEVASRIQPGWPDKPRTVSLAHFGLRMEVIPRDAVGKSVYLYGEFEVRETHFVRTTLQPGQVFVDVGANAGYYTLLASRLVGNTGLVVAFEPSPRIRAQLERNVHLNGLENVSIRSQAIAREQGQARFFESADPRNSGIASLRPGEGREAKPLTVETTTLDAVAAGLGRRIDLLKIDVEGAELDVIAGGERTLSAPDAPTIVFEHFGDGEIFAALQSLGYEVRALCFDPGRGLRLVPDLHARDVFSPYEAPSFVATKGSRRILDRLATAPS